MPTGSTKVSIIPRGVAALGLHPADSPRRTGTSCKRAELLDRIDVLLGGRVAEEIVFGDISTGAQDDLQRATDLARHMVTQYGMSDRLGLVTFEEPRTNPFLNSPPPRRSREYSEKTAQTIDEEIRDHRRRPNPGAETLTGRRAALDALAKLLLEKEVVDRAALDQLLNRPKA